MKISVSRLKNLALVAQQEVGAKGPWDIDSMSAGKRLVDTGTGRDISPRLPSGQLAEWLWAFIQGAREVKSNQTAKS